MSETTSLQPGTKVKVRADCGTPEYREMTGTVIEIYGRSGYAAFDVQLEGGRSELFWSHELEEELPKPT